MRSPEDRFGRRSGALGHLGAFYLASGDRTTAEQLWSAAERPLYLDGAMCDFAIALVANGVFLLEPVRQHALVVRTVSIRQNLLSRLGYKLAQPSVETADPSVVGNDGREATE